MGDLLSPESDTSEKVSQSAGEEHVTSVMRSSYKRGLVTGICIALGITVIVSTALLILHRFGIVGATPDSKASLIKSIVSKYYYEDVSYEDMQVGMYRGIVESTGDPYSTYYTAEEFKKAKQDLLGNYAGIGALLGQDKKTGVVTVSEVYDDSPAQKAGIRAGDEIISADGMKAASMELSDFVQKLRGEVGTDVVLVIGRDGQEKEYTVTRDIVTTPSVAHTMLEGGIGYVAISDFSSGTADEFNEAIEDLNKQGMKAVIFDLRTNPGGLVDSVTEILDTILPRGVTVYLLDKDGKRKDYSSDEKHRMEIPIAVLTSSQTASAAEIFAGAIRDFEYGTLIGQKTYGKGIVQRTIPLTDGSAVKLTVERYYTPSGECIHGEGITPDIELEYDYSGDPKAEEYDYLADNQIAKAIEVLTKDNK